MASPRVEAYAKALLEIARAEGDLGAVEDELFRVARTIESNDALRNALTDQTIPVDMRQGIVEDLLGGRATNTTTNLVSFVVGAGRSRDLPAIIDELIQGAAESRDEEVAEVRTAHPLSEDQRRRLTQALERRFDRKIDLKVTVDPEVLGGIVVTIGDEVLDGSVKSRLQQLKKSL